MPKKCRPCRVRIRGLRFFLEKTEGRVSREKLIEFVQRFFTSRRISVRFLRVEFRQSRHPTSVIDGQRRLVWGLMHPCENRVEIFVNTTKHPMHWLDVLETLGHELDHEAWEKEKGGFDDSLPYSQRPHEIRARRVGSQIRRFFSTWQSFPPTG